MHTDVCPEQLARELSHPQENIARKTELITPNPLSALNMKVKVDVCEAVRKFVYLKK